MKHYSILLLLMLPLVVSMAACGERSEAAGAIKAETIPVQVIPVEKVSAQKSIAVAGQFTTDDEVFLSFKTGGIIHRILVKEGDAVRQGQVLAILNLTEINAQAQQAQLAFEKAQRDHQRVQNLYRDSVATLEQLQNAKTALDLASQQLSAVQFNRNYSEIRSPRNGFVLRKLANEGQVVSAGTPVLQTNGAQAGNWLLRIGLSDREWASIRLNDKATITTEALPGQAFTGIVSRKSESVDPATGSFVVDIKLTGHKPDAIASGMFGKAVISPAAADNGQTPGETWAIPYDALLDGDGSTGFVFITNDDRTATRVKVRITSMEKDRIIISDGLLHAKKLIVSGSAYLTDNSAITIIPNP